MVYFQEIPLQFARERHMMPQFMATFHLSFDDTIEYCVAAFEDISQELIAAAALQGNIIRNVAILPAYQGQGLTAKLLSHILTCGAEHGIYSFCLFTTPEKREQFTTLGFRHLATARPYVTLLELGTRQLSSWLQQTTAAIPPASDRAAIVMNANPFTLGHRYLAEIAASQHESLVVFIVQENRSLIPFSDRLQLARKNLADLPNVTVLPGGPYIISNATFPAYFLKSADVAPAQAQLDAVLFAEKIAPYFTISHRYVGDEPVDTVTAAYNTALKSILPPRGIQVHILSRKKSADSIISAATVRSAWKCHNWSILRHFVSPITLAYLQTTSPAMFDHMSL